MKNQNNNQNKKEAKLKAESARTRPRVLRGEVVSVKQDKTAVVSVNRYKLHPKYHKRYRSTNRYQAHDENNNCKLGDRVKIKETRPISKNKKWMILE